MFFLAAQLGITEGALVAVLAVVGGGVTNWISGRQVRRTQWDTVVADREQRNWVRLERANKELTTEVVELRHENKTLRETVEHQEERIARLEQRS